jgi:hypothetical protein
MTPDKPPNDAACHGKGRRKSDGCPMFASAYMGRKRWGAARRSLFHSTRKSRSEYHLALLCAARGVPQRFLKRCREQGILDKLVISIGGVMRPRPTQRDEKCLRARNHFPWKGRPFLCHPERSRGVCSSAGPSWKCFSTERSAAERSAVSSSSLLRSKRTSRQPSAIVEISRHHP